jgi:hypothetical protein
VLPALEEYSGATNVQDETWQKADGTFLTKYDWSAFLRDQTYYGVYGDEVGSWYINPGKDYYNGDQLKGELMACLPPFIIVDRNYVLTSLRYIGRRRPVTLFSST